MPTTRKITTKPVTAAKPVAAKPATTKPAIAAEAANARAAIVPTQAAIANATAIVAAAAKPSGSIVRTAATIAKQATNFATISDRDTAYLAFFRKLAARHGGTVDASHIAAAVTSGERPDYAGSCKPNDAGVRVRLHKAGHIVNSADGISFTLASPVAPKA